MSEAADLAARGSTLDTRSLSQIERTIRAGVAARRAIAERGDLPALAGDCRGNRAVVALGGGGDRPLGRGGRVRPEGFGLARPAAAAPRAPRGPWQAGRAPPQDRPRPCVGRAPAGRFRDRARRTSRAGAEILGARTGARDRARLVRLRPDAVHRATRGGRRLEPAARGRGRRARRGGPDPPQPLSPRSCTG